MTLWQLRHWAGSRHRKTTGFVPVLSIAIFGVGCGDPTEDSFATAVGRPVKLYVAAGQSNMVGFGGFSEKRHRVPHHLIRYRYRSQTGTGLGPLQTTPLFFRHGSIRHGIYAFCDRGVGPWWAFAQELAKQQNESEIRVLMLAVNGSSLIDWCREGGLLDQAIAFIREETSRGATLEGMIWHQGEAGVGSQEGDYGGMLEELVLRLRSQAGVANLPFVAASLPDTSPNAALVNAALERVAATVPRVAIVNGQGMTLSDSVHLDSASNETIGMAMAKAMIEMIAVPVPDAP